MAKSSRRYLDLRGLKYWFKRDIPAAVRIHFGGKSAYLVNLETGDIRAAMTRRDELKRETDKLFQDARVGRFSAANVDSIQSLAEIWAKEAEEAERDPRGWTAKITGRKLALVEDHETDSPHGFIMEEAERIEQTHGEEGRDRFLNLVQGRVDVAHHVDAYMREVRLAANTKRERKSLILRFADWAKLQGKSLPEINRALAGRYFSEVIAPLHPQTAKKHIGSVKLYWDFLIARGHIAGSNPWEGQRLPDRGRRVERGDERDERAFTEAEIKTLLCSPYPPRMQERFKQQLHDVMRIAALTGMRVGEIVTLWVEECPIAEDDAGYFDIRQGKTAAAARRVPMHSDLLEIVKRRSKGKGPQDWLFDELADERDPGDTFGKRFRQYRLKLGVNDQQPGKRRSLVNFHSFRRWFITEAERAGVPESTISSVVGHEEGRKSITFGTYSEGPAWQQMRACVDAVGLPTFET